MKKIAFLLLLFTSISNAQIVNIPDANFKAKLLAANSSNTIAKNIANNYFKIDANDDGEIQESEALQVSYLDVSASSIASLVGINSFTNINRIECNDNVLTSLDVSNLLNLSVLICDSNQIASLNISNSNNLEELHIANNQLNTLPLSTSLIVLSCDTNFLTNLDLSQCKNLEQISCSANNLTSINFKNGKILNLQNTYDGYLLNIDISNNPNLSFICFDEAIGNLNLFLSNIGLTNCVANSYCSFTPGGNFNTIKGTITFDANTNGCDALDVLQPNIRMNINDGTNEGATYSNNSGDYTFYTQTGSFNLLPSLENPTWFTLSPTTATVPFANNNNNITTQNFCITPNGVHNDLEIVIAPIIPARPGYDATYQIVFKNKGNQTLSGAINLTYNDAILDFVTASTTPDNQTTGNLSWNYTNLLPFENRTILITLNVNSPEETPAVTIGDILPFSATINPVSGDETTADNVFDYNQTVVGAYDPNSVECLEGETIDPALIDNYLHYIINFENLGNIQAENVVVKDIINTNQYDINSIQILNTSHNSYTKLKGNTLEFIFEGINLAPTSGNPPVGGHGTVLFKIKPNDNLHIDDTVHKQVSIFFDYNAPLQTNSEITTFTSLTNSIPIIDESIAIYPNPATSIITIHCKNKIQSIELYDVGGRLLIAKTADSLETTLDITNQFNGIYFLKINSANGSKAMKIIKNK
ncbi:Secretion system C-terminal sorting domain-containing protein [Flavobacterium branchiophilum]|uniref:Uncharacterized protein n=1 Tax=Flavobacterium branchiophilum (strain FL-15) TaxID=1034807 RepID=G2Z5V4_FLABF|nr:T9SS type A sorting domain-containing protein [Flavobacterium branchiophilum]CCB68714.1 Protein of unknown function precursor [Flavobacterium branchiophilum FL-15]